MCRFAATSTPLWKYCIISLSLPRAKRLRMRISSRCWRYALLLRRIRFCCCCYQWLICTEFIMLRKA
jgi:hypothetical protein